jgi:signal-transduction protein with cAMP-binding, CBS, and nucleotidyltransferase domain
MDAFLSSIKIFGYLDRPVFHELARNLQTRKIKKGEILFDVDDENRDFYVVVDGNIQTFCKSSEAVTEDDLLFDVDVHAHEWKGHVLINESRNGGICWGINFSYRVFSILDSIDIHG